jgi:hypothetical protein
MFEEKIRIIREERQALIDENWMPNTSSSNPEKTRRSVVTTGGDDSNIVQRVRIFGRGTAIC